MHDADKANESYYTKLPEAWEFSTSAAQPCVE